MLHFRLAFAFGVVIVVVVVVVADDVLRLMWEGGKNKKKRNVGGKREFSINSMRMLGLFWAILR